MKFKTPLIEGRLIKRYKRFLADVLLESGQIITAHTANTGKMLGCAEPGSRVWLSLSGNDKRKYPHTWELVEVNQELNPSLVGINTHMSNVLVHELLTINPPVELSGFSNIRREVAYGEKNSRIDLLLEYLPNNGTSNSKFTDSDCYLEVKNVTLVKNRVAFFPDAVTKRGLKHLNELAYMVSQGRRAVIFFCIQREDVEEFRPAEFIDPDYAEALATVLQNGVKALAYCANVSTDEIRLNKAIPVKV